MSAKSWAPRLRARRCRTVFIPWHNTKVFAKALNVPVDVGYHNVTPQKQTARKVQRASRVASHELTAPTECICKHRVDGATAASRSDVRRAAEERAHAADGVAWDALF
jgi:hypothetical protein